jgi:ABC-type branched-subunit amino acid transport system substrate-binding protein
MLSAGGAAVEGTYVWIQSLPFEEAEENEALAAYVDAVGEGEVDTWGAQSWGAAIAFKQAVDDLVAAEGPNAITRSALLDALRSLEDFDAAGMTGPRKLGEYSPCYVMMQVKDGGFVRAWPEEPGTFDCEETNVVKVTVNPERAAASDLR